MPHQLSGGEQQKLVIARALLNDPELILADEPTGNLDPLNAYEIIKLLLKINELGTTVILATHNKEIIDSLGKRVVILDKGKLIRDEENGKLFNNLIITPTVAPIGEIIEVKVDVKIPVEKGEEVVQLYVRDVVSSVATPPIQLKDSNESD